MNLSHISRDEFNSCVYEPGDDSFLLVDALLADVKGLTSPLLCLEIGCGSGYVSMTAASAWALEGLCCFWMLSDIAPGATSAALRTAANVPVPADAMVQDLLTGIRPFEQFDVIVFNPPYVPSEEGEAADDPLRRTWAGGEDGREVLDRLLPVISQFLAPHGRFYLVTVKENKPKEIQRLLQEYGLKGRLVKRKQAHNEDLMILRFTK